MEVHAKNYPNLFFEISIMIYIIINRPIGLHYSPYCSFTHNR